MCIQRPLFETPFVHRPYLYTTRNNASSATEFRAPFCPPRHSKKNPRGEIDRLSPICQITIGIGKLLGLKKPSTYSLTVRSRTWRKFLKCYVISLFSVPFFIYQYMALFFFRMAKGTNQVVFVIFFRKCVLLLGKMSFGKRTQIRQQVHNAKLSFVRGLFVLQFANNCYFRQNSNWAFGTFLH